MVALSIRLIASVLAFWATFTVVLAVNGPVHPASGIPTEIPPSQVDRLWREVWSRLGIHPFRPERSAGFTRRMAPGSPPVVEDCIIEADGRFRFHVRDEAFLNRLRTQCVAGFPPYLASTHNFLVDVSLLLPCMAAALLAYYLLTRRYLRTRCPCCGAVLRSLATAHCPRCGTSPYAVPGDGYTHGRPDETLDLEPRQASSRRAPSAAGIAPTVFVLAVFCLAVGLLGTISSLSASRGSVWDYVIDYRSITTDLGTVAGASAGRSPGASAGALGSHRAWPSLVMKAILLVTCCVVACTLIFHKLCFPVWVRTRDPQCWRCGYCLVGIAEPRCPECGEEVR